MDKNITPWQIIIKHLKGQTSLDEETFLQEWLTYKANRMLYMQAKKIWQDVLEEGIQFRSQKEDLWNEVEKKMDTKVESKTYLISKYQVKWILSIASIFLVTLLISTFYVTNEWDKLKNNEIRVTYTTLNGKSKVLLPDGTSVWLQPNSELTYHSTPDKEREVTLNGVAFFDVEKDEKRPFRVESFGTEIKVFGTSFHVEAKAAAEDIKIGLLSGSVAVSTRTTSLHMEPGELAVCSRQNGHIRMADEDLSFISLWAQDHLHIERKSIQEVARLLSFWYDVGIHTDPSLPGGQAYTFTLRNEPLDEVLRILNKTASITYEYESDNSIFLNLIQCN